MKRSLLTLMVAAVAVAGYGFPAMESHPEALQRITGLNLPKSVSIDYRTAEALRQQTLTSADDEMSRNWSYSEGAYSAIPANYGEYKGAVKFSKELATEYAGATLTSISVAGPVDISTRVPNYDLMVYEYKNPVKTCKVWISESLEGEPLIQTEGNLSDKGVGWNEI